MPTADWFPTLLALDGITYPDWAIRGCTVAVAPIESGELVRDARGTLVDLTVEAFRKVQITVTCTDMDAPDLVDVWRGKPVGVTVIEGLGLNETAGPRTYNCFVDSWASSRDEYAATTNWSLSLLEV